MSIEEGYVPKLLDSKSPQQELESTINKSKESNENPQPGEEINKDTPGRVTLRSDTNANLSKDKLLNQICDELDNATEERVLVFQTVDTETAHSTATELDRLAEGKGYRLSYNSLLKTLKIILMPNLIHGCHQPWLISNMAIITSTGILMLQEHQSLRILSGTMSDSLSINSGPSF
ncbi:hypothetical protein VTN96DRAFT_5838 [Rasamsonia emersonii]